MFPFLQKANDFSKAKISSQTVENSMVFSDFLNGYRVCFSLFTLTFYFQFFSCCTKNYAVSTKKYFKRNYVAQQNYVSHNKIFYSNKKI